MRYTAGFLLVLLLILIANNFCAAVMVSPVVIDAHLVEQGREFTITLTNTKPYVQSVALGLGWFNLSLDGSVNLDWDEMAKIKALKYIDVDQTAHTLQPLETKKVVIRVISQDFTSISPVLFVEVSGSGVRPRLAVLLILSTYRPHEHLLLKKSSWQPGSLMIELANPNSVHTLFKGQLQLFQAETMIDQIYLSNYQVLAESERRLVIPIQTDADKIVVVSENLAGGSITIEQ